MTDEASRASFEHIGEFVAAPAPANVRLGRLESIYQELFSEVIEDGVITREERSRLEKMADSLGLDRTRLRNVERALQAAYEARHLIPVREVDDEVPPMSIAPLEPTTDPRTLALERRIKTLESRIVELERDLEEARAMAAVEVDFSDIGGAKKTEDDPLELLRRLRHDPRDESSLHGIFRLHTKAQDHDARTRTAEVLDFLGVATDEEKAALRPLDPSVLIRPRAAVSPEAWSRLVAPPEQEPLVGEIFSVVASSVLLGRLSALRRDRALVVLDPAKLQAPKTSTIQAVRCFDWAAAILGLSSPPLYVDPGFDGAAQMIPAVPPATRIGQKALQGRSAKELAFIAGRHLSGYRAEHFVRILVPGVQALEDIFLAALHIGNPGLPLAAHVKELVLPIAQAIEPMLEPGQIDQLRGAFLRFVEEGGRTNLQRWAQAVDRTSARAGLLLAGDLRAAHAALALDGTPADATMDDLLAFWLSDRCGKLRKQMGLATSE